MLYLTLLVLPACTIYVWERFVARTAPHAWAFYAGTGLIGSPVHELAHVIGCVLFRLPIRKVVLYKPDRATGILGYVNFAYLPGSWTNRIGMAVQGIAPLIAGATIVVIALGLSPYPPHDHTAAGMADWFWTAVRTPFPALRTLALDGPLGFAGALAVVCISLHAIPSLADMRVGWTGASAILLLVIALSALFFLAFGIDSSALSRINIVRELLSALEYWLWCLSFGVIAVVSIAIGASTITLLLPAFISTSLHRTPRQST